MKKWFFLILGCLIVVLGITRWLISKKSSTLEVGIYNVETSEFVSQVEASGKITSRKIITLHSKNNGIIQNIPPLIQVGSKVSEGAFLGEVKTTAEETKSIKNDLKRSKTELEIARRKCELSANLFKLKAISENELIREKLDYENKKIRVQELKEKLTPQKLTAPFSGVISENKVENGEIVKKEGRLFTLCDMDRLIAELDVNEKDIARVKNGQEVIVTCDASPGILKGEVERTSIVAKEDERSLSGSSTFAVIVSIENSANTILRIGGSVLGKIIIQRKPDTISIPLEAVLYDEESKPYLFVYNTGKAIRRVVKTGLSSSEFVEIISGLKPGEKLITSGNIYVKNNTSVKLRKAPFYEGF
jgi:RND family efflux transporter MFP subunit